MKDRIVIIEINKGMDGVGLTVKEKLTFAYFMFAFLTYHVQKPGKQFSMCQKFWEKERAGNINLNIINIQEIFQVSKLHRITSGIRIMQDQRLPVVVNLWHMYRSELFVSLKLLKVHRHRIEPWISLTLTVWRREEESAKEAEIVQSGKMGEKPREYGVLEAK